jgi:hypothetical protein
MEYPFAPNLMVFPLMVVLNFFSAMVTYLVPGIFSTGIVLAF